MGFVHDVGELGRLVLDKVISELKRELPKRL